MATEYQTASYPKLKQRVEYLFDVWKRHRQRQPELIDVVTPELYERGRLLALQLAEQAAPMVLLHGDMNQGNVLDGGNDRGLASTRLPALATPHLTRLIYSCGRFMKSAPSRKDHNYLLQRSAWTQDASSIGVWLSPA
jgi:rhodanese-related sulfurtransferase